MPTPNRRALSLALLILAATAPLHAQRRQYLLELGAGGSVTSFASVTNLHSGFGGALRLGFWLPWNLGIELEGLTASPKTIGGASTNVLTGTASLLVNIRAGESSSLFLRGGAGSTRYGSGSCPAISDPASDPPCGSAASLVFGGGFRAALSPTVMLRGDVDYQRNGSGATAFSNVLGGLGLAVMVGSQPLIDSDRDGVFDRDDKCPNTPLGAIVDKRGCPSDTDGDGVPDGLDRCPNTPAGAIVDASGCPSDTDKDGVVDGVDQCPDTPAGAQVDARGCPIDSDGDGVPDGIDRCPNTPAGATVDALGCPGDADNDKVPDGIDQCPNTPAGVVVNSFGCPAASALPGPVPGAAGPGSSSGKSWRIPGTAFAPQSSTIGSTALSVLKQVSTFLRANPRAVAEIVGHADDAASEAANVQLSAARAAAVRSYLLRQGVLPRQLQTRGAGSTEADPSGAAASNRRTEIRILGS